MTCVVRKVLGGLPDLNVKSVRTHSGKIVLDQCRAHVQYVQVDHARFLLSKNMSPDAIRRECKRIVATPIPKLYLKVLEKETGIFNETVDQFNDALIEYAYSHPVSATIEPVPHAYIENDAVDIAQQVRVLKHFSRIIGAIVPIEKLDELVIDTPLDFPDWKECETEEQMDEILQIALRNANLAAEAEKLAVVSVKNMFIVCEFMKGTMKILSGKNAV